MRKIAQPIVADGRRSIVSLNRRGEALVAFAAALATLVTVAAPAASKPFQQYLNGACGSTICRINFAKVPTGQRLTLDNVSCYLRLTRGPLSILVGIRAAQLLVIGGNPSRAVSAVTLVPQRVDLGGQDDTIHSANHDIAAFASAGQRFQAYIELLDGAGFSQVACHVSGDLAKA